MPADPLPPEVEQARERAIRGALLTLLQLDRGEIDGTREAVLRAFYLSAQVAQAEEDARAIVAACGMCSGEGYVVTSSAAHGCGGDDARCVSMCPVEVQEREGCEYCGRPVRPIHDRLASLRAQLQALNP